MLVNYRDNYSNKPTQFNSAILLQYIIFPVSTFIKGLVTARN